MKDSIRLKLHSPAIIHRGQGTPIQNALSRFQDKSILVLWGSAFEMAANAPAFVPAAPLALPESPMTSTSPHFIWSSPWKLLSAGRPTPSCVDDSIIKKGNRRKKRLGDRCAFGGNICMDA